jgi:hypothetical protein
VILSENEKLKKIIKHHDCIEFAFREEKRKIEEVVIKICKRAIKRE